MRKCKHGTPRGLKNLIPCEVCTEELPSKREAKVVLAIETFLKTQADLGEESDEQERAKDRACDRAMEALDKLKVEVMDFAQEDECADSMVGLVTHGVLIPQTIRVVYRNEYLFAWRP